jgi:hypothetical protein
MRKAILCLLLSAGAGAADRVSLQAGLARVRLTPAGSMPMYGYSNRKCGDSNGEHDALWAKALVLQTGESRFALVSMDIGSLVSERLKRDVAEKLGIPVLLLAASHTHSGPRFLPAEGSTEAPPPYLGEIEEKIFEAVRSASQSMFPARLSTARGSIQLGYNRLLPRDDGRSRALFDNLERIPYGPVDPEFMLLRVDDAEGRARALLTHYGVHAVVLGPTNCKYSADYPGVLQQKVEEAMPGVQAMFVQGGAGDVNPLFMARSGDEVKDFAVVAKMGETLAGEVLRAAKAMQPVALSGPIAYRSDLLKFGDRWEKGKSIGVGITTILLGREIAIAAVPGEPLHKLQTAWKERAEVPFPLFYGYTWSAGGGWPGYLPDLRSAAHGGYGADNATRIEAGAGEAVVERHLIQLYGLLGMWRDQPGRP